MEANTRGVAPAAAASGRAGYVAGQTAGQGMGHAAAGAPAGSVRKALRVLIVEDWFPVAEMVGSMVRDLGHVVCGPFPEPEEAVAFARGNAVDIAVVDVQLERGDGVALAASLAAMGVPVVFMTGYDPGSEVSLPPGSQCLRKPFGETALELAITRTLDGREACRR